MAISNIIAAGIGFSPGSVEFIVTRGFGSSSGVAGPYCVVEQEVYLPGAADGEVFLAGSVASEVFLAGTANKAGQVGCG